MMPSVSGKRRLEEIMIYLKGVLLLNQASVALAFEKIPKRYTTG